MSTADRLRNVSADLLAVELQSLSLNDGGTSQSVGRRISCVALTNVLHASVQTQKHLIMKARLTVPPMILTVSTQYDMYGRRST